VIDVAVEKKFACLVPQSIRRSTNSNSEANVETSFPFPWCIDKTKDAAMLLHRRLHGLQHIGIEALLSLLKLQMHVPPGSSDCIALIKSFKR